MTERLIQTIDGGLGREMENKRVENIDRVTWVLTVIGKA